MRDFTGVDMGLKDPCPVCVVLKAEVERLVYTMVRLLMSSDASWYDGKHGGHDWREAVDEAHLLLVKVDRRMAGKGGREGAGLQAR